MTERNLFWALGGPIDLSGLTMESGFMLGRSSAGSGPIELVSSFDSLVARPSTYVLEGASVAAGQTSLDAVLGGGAAMSDATMGIPVPSDMVTSAVAVSWRSGTAPSGDWTATLWRRTAGGAFTAVATFDFQTS